MKLLVQNSKMRKTSEITGIDLFNFGLPAYQSACGVKTCPQALMCVSGCYARSGTYQFSNVKAAYQARFELALTETFVKAMSTEIKTKLKTAQRRKRQLMIRVHDSGDFFSKSYRDQWFSIMAAYPTVKFYAYTKSIDLFKGISIPENFRLIYSLGGKLDSLIDLEKDTHAKVFPSIADLEAAGYTNGTENDIVAGLGQAIKIGLVYHGTKGIQKTGWVR